MAKDANHSGFSGVLYSALTDSKKCEVLLEHPVFRHRAMRICHQIAGPDNVEDLFHETCLRVTKYVGTRNPENLPTEDKFFSWFSALARNVHLSERRRMLDTATCVEMTRYWPDTSTDVSPEELGEFLDHAEACHYHAELLQEEEQQEEEDLRSVFRLARGLDSHGDVLQGRVLDAAIAEQERRLKNWKAAAGKAKFPFSHIALYNGGREIASCGKFLDFSKHESVNELDPRAGIQIRGINTVDETKDVLLGFYPLAGVRHEGDEQLLPLDNGYSVGLSIYKLDQKTFAVHFRCVESNVIEEERSGTSYGGSRVRKGVGRAAGAGSSATGGPSSMQLAAGAIVLRMSNNPSVFARWAEQMKRLRLVTARSGPRIGRRLVTVTYRELFKSFMTRLAARPTLAALAAGLLLVVLLVGTGRQANVSSRTGPSARMTASNPDSVERRSFLVHYLTEAPGHLSNMKASDAGNFLATRRLNSGLLERNFEASFCPVSLSSDGYQGRPKSLFTIYDGDWIRKDEFTFIVAYSGPSAFAHPLDAQGAARILQLDWRGLGPAYRRHRNEQDVARSDVDLANAHAPGASNGFTVQFWAEHRNHRLLPPNQPPTVSISSSNAWSIVPPQKGTSSATCEASAHGSVELTVNARDPDNDKLVYVWSVSGGRIKGEGRSVTWDLSGISPGTHFAHVKVSDGNGHTVSASVTMTVSVVSDYSRTQLTNSGQ